MPPLIRHRQINSAIDNARQPRYNQFMTNYAMFRCQFCDGQIDPDAGGTMHLVTGWVNVGSNSGLRVVEKNWKYAHKVCVETKPIKEQVETLF